MVTRPGYSPTDVLQAGPQPTDVLDVLYHVSHVVISAWRCGALIQRNFGDNHGQSPLVHLEGPLRGPLGPCGPQPGLRADPGGVKNYPPRVTVGI